MSQSHVLIIGGGGTGAAVAYDLALRGLRVTLVERGEVTSGTTGRHHGLLHSGARYVVRDPPSARECIQENRILRRIAPESFELNGGLFVALTEDDLAYRPHFLEACAACGIPARELRPEEALRREPNLNPALKAVVEVPDATMDPWRLTIRFLASAKHHGAEIRTFTEVIAILLTQRTVTGVRVEDYHTGRIYDIDADMVVNAAGPWAGRVATLAGVSLPMHLCPGVMVAVEGRWTNRVINRMHPPGDGDTVVPQRALSVIGTTSWVVEDPDQVCLPEQHVRLMLEKGTEMVPAIERAGVRAAWSAVRPLVAPGEAITGRELSRTFDCFDHAVRDGVEGFVTVVGGKATTARAMAEATGTMVCRKLRIDVPCRTREVPLLPHTAYYA